MTMNRTKWSAAGLAAAAALAATGCDTDSLTSLNDNPNNPTTAPAGSVFTNAARLGATRWLGQGYNLIGTSLLAQHLAQVQYPESDQYTRLRANTTQDYFNESYTGELKDLRQAIQAGLAQEAPGIYAPARALLVWNFGYITDSWGDVPYTSALAGDSSEAVTSPVYDTQESIYADFFATLASVSADLQDVPAGTARLGAADPIYAGAPAAWQRFANSLRARYAMRLANVDAATARREVAAALAAPGGLFTSNAHNARVAWPGGVNATSNPWSVNFATRDDFRISATMMTLLRDYADPRTAVWAQRAEQDATNPVLVKYCATGTPCYVGLQNALTHDQASPFVPNTSRPGLIFYPSATTYGVSGGSGTTTPSYLLTFAEVSFIKAEAAERGWIAGSARTFYEDGIRASMEQWGVTDAAAVAAYLAQPSVAYAGGVDGQKQIARQKWLALFTDGGQAWAEWRRTCQPSNIRPGPAAAENAVPRRFQYSLTERLTNRANYDAAVTAQGGDAFATRIYWDKNPTAAPTYEPGCGER